MDETLATYRTMLGTLKRALDERSVRARLLGAPVEPVFRRTSQFNTRPAPAGSRA